MVFNVLELCAGIGGMTLGMAISGGFKTICFCEINSYCQQILSLRFPEVPIIADIKDVSIEFISRSGIEPISIDGIVAGFPCQPFSEAGKKKASNDSRNLWGEVERVIRTVHPRWAVLENVPGLLTAESGRYFAGIIRSLSQVGYVCEWGVLSAATVGAVHRRERLWIIAYTPSQGRSKRQGEATQFTDDITSYSQSNRRETSRNQYTQNGTDFALIGSDDFGDSNQEKCEQRLGSIIEGRQESLQRHGLQSTTISQPSVCGSDDGFSSGMDGCLMHHDQLDDWLTAATIPSFTRFSAEEIAALTREEQLSYRQLWAEYQAIRRQQKEQLMALGNAVVPQCAAKIFDFLKLRLNQ